MTIFIDKLKSYIGNGNYRAALDGIVGSLDPFADFSSHHQLIRLMRSLPAAELQLRPLKLALLATSTVDHLSEVLRLYLAREGFAAEIFQSEYDTLYQSALDPSSALYSFHPDVIWLFTNYRDLDLKVTPGVGDPVVAAAVNAAISRIKTL